MVKWWRNGKSMIAVALGALLGIRLMTRNTRKLSVTNTGLLFAQHAQRILNEIKEAKRVVSEQQALRGTFRINLLMSFDMNHLSP